MAKLELLCSVWVERVLVCLAWGILQVLVLVFVQVQVSRELQSEQVCEQCQVH